MKYNRTLVPNQHESLQAMILVFVLNITVKPNQQQ